MTQPTVRQASASSNGRPCGRAIRATQHLKRTADGGHAHETGLEQPPPTKRKRDLSRFVGTLSDEQEREFLANTIAFETID